MKRTTARTSALLTLGIFLAIGIGWCPGNASAATINTPVLSWSDGTNGPNGYNSYIVPGLANAVPAAYQVARGDVTDAHGYHAWSTNNISTQSFVEWKYQRNNKFLGPGDYADETD